MSHVPKGQFDPETKVLTWREDVTEKDRAELEPMLCDAFKVGLRDGYRQGREKGTP